MNYMFTAQSLNPVRLSSLEEAREYMREYASVGHRDCRVWYCMDRMDGMQATPEEIESSIQAKEAIDNWVEEMRKHALECRAPAKVNAKEERGRKFDEGKVRLSLLPLDVLQEVLDVLEHGARKYAADNWKHVPNAQARYIDAAFRHSVLQRISQGEVRDQETGKLHYAHAICCLIFLAWFDLQNASAPIGMKDTMQMRLPL